MTADFRINTGVLDHPKIKKLIRKKGYEEGFIRLFRLWGWTAENRPKGILTNMDMDDIAIAMNFPDGTTEQCTDLINFLIELRLLDKLENGDLALHDWKDHNPFAYFAPERKEAAQKAAKARWQKKRGQGVNAGRNADGMRVAMRKSEIRNAPSPIPIPIPLINSSNEGLLSGKKHAVRSDNGIPFKAIIDDLNKKLGTRFSPTAKLTQRLIKARFKEGFCLENFLIVNSKKIREWGNNPKMVGNLKPATLYSEKFEGYLNQKEIKAAGDDGDLDKYDQI